jgi:hypothetical protein
MTDPQIGTNLKPPGPPFLPLVVVVDVQEQAKDHCAALAADDTD